MSRNCTASIHKVYNCFGRYDATMCCHCIYNPQPLEGETSDCHRSYADGINELYQFLLPKVSTKQAFAVIYFLQKRLHVLPDCIEQCSVCKELFDTDSEGVYGGDEDDDDKKKKHHFKFYCDNCIPDDLYKNRDE